MAEKDFEVLNGGGEGADALGVMDKLRGHSSIVIEDEDGTEYTLRYPRKLVKQMEAAGITSQTVAAKMGDGTLTAMEEFVKEFVMPAFKADQPKIGFDTVLGVYEQLPDKAEFIQLLMGLFMQPTLALTTDPTETRMKFRLA